VPAADLHATKQPEQTAAPEFAHASAGARVTYSLTLPAELTREHPDGSAVFYVQPLNSSGRGAGFSNAAAVPLAPAYPPPDSFKARQTKPAIVLTWTPEPPNSMNSTRISGYRIARREAGAQSDDERLFVASDSPSNGHLSDSQFTWGKRYSYRIATVTGVYSSTGEKIAEVDGDWSQSLEENATDVFPPSQPSAVQAVFTQIGPQRFIDLTWLPDTDSDIAGYFVYRRVDGGQPRKLNSAPVQAPAYHDTQIAPGTRYFYSVSAVDVRGNESARSEETSELSPP
jgi:hypothetical protein